MRIGFFVVILIASLIVAAAHVGVMVSILNFFHLGPGSLRKIIVISTISLGFSFVVMSFLVFWTENLLTRILYTIASGWLGTFVYVVIAVIAAWIVVLGLRVLGLQIDSSVIATSTLLLALVFSIYGIWNAANPVVKHISVKLDGLPEQWRGKTIVQVSDVHLGAIRRSGFCKKVVDLVNGENPDMVVITGDLFDGGGRDLHNLVSPLNSIIAPKGVYFITGNHETYVGVQRSLDALAQINLRTLRDEVVEIDGIRLIGIDYPISQQRKSLSDVLAKIDKIMPNILLYHEPRFVDSLKQLGVDLQLAGHTHRGQMWPFNYISRRVYDGLDYGLYKDGSYHLYTSCGAGTWGPPLRSANRPEIVAISLE